MGPLTSATARRRRAYVRVAGPDARDFLQRLLSNDVEALEVGASCEALLLTPKGRVIAPLVVWRRGEEDYLLLTEPELGGVVGSHLARLRLRARVEIAPEEHVSTLVFGDEGARAGGIANSEYGQPAWELLDVDLPPTLGEEELEILRIRAGTPRFGREIDERVLPAEAGLDERAISFTKGCFPGQEPVARLRYRGHVNRRLRVLAIDAAEPPPYDAEIVYAGKVVGRVTSAARDGDGVIALGYVRVEVPEQAELAVGGARARLHLPSKLGARSSGDRAQPCGG
jgi:folate-binding protein YgfZ